MLWCRNTIKKIPYSVFTCLKQKGMVSTLTPTMLFTTFIIKPQLDDVILAFLKCTAFISEIDDQQWHTGVVFAFIPM